MPERGLERRLAAEWKALVRRTGAEVEARPSWLAPGRPVFPARRMALFGQLEEVLALWSELRAAPLGDEHPAPAPLLDETLVDELLISLEDGERIERELGRDAAHRRQCIAVGELTLQDHGDHLVAKLPIYGLAVVPGGIHRGRALRCFAAVL